MPPAEVAVACPQPRHGAEAALERSRRPATRRSRAQRIDDRAAAAGRATDRRGRAGWIGRASSPRSRRAGADRGPAQDGRPGGRGLERAGGVEAEAALRGRERWRGRSCAAGRAAYFAAMLCCMAAILPCQDGVCKGACRSRSRDLRCQRATLLGEGELALGEPRGRAAATPGACGLELGEVGAQRPDVAAGDRAGQGGSDPEGAAALPSVCSISGP